jgi:DNA-binding MarR family transcriptional regulator
MKKTKDTFFAQITREITHLNISPIARLVYIELMIYTNSGKTKAYPSNGTLAKDLNISKTTAKAAMKELEESRLIKKTARKKEAKLNDTNLIQVLPVGRSKLAPGVGQNLAQGGADIDQGVGQIPTTKERKNKNRNIKRETDKERKNTRQGTAMKKTPDEVLEQVKELRTKAGLPKLSKAREDKIKESVLIEPTSERDIHVRKYLDGEIGLAELIKVTDSKPIKILDIRKPENFRCLEETVTKMGLADFLN